MSKTAQIIISDIVEYDGCSINEDFHLIWWPVKKKCVPKLHPDAEQAVIVFDYQEHSAYVQILLKHSTGENGTRIDYDFTDEDMDFMEEAAEDLDLLPNYVEETDAAYDD